MYLSTLVVIEKYVVLILVLYFCRSKFLCIVYEVLSVILFAVVVFMCYILVLAIDTCFARLSFVYDDVFWCYDLGHVGRAASIE